MEIPFKARGNQRRMDLSFTSWVGPSKLGSLVDHPTFFQSNAAVFYESSTVWQAWQEKVKDKFPLHWPPANLQPLFSELSRDTRWYKKALWFPELNGGSYLREREQCVSKMLYSRMKGFCVWFEQSLPWVGICNNARWLISTGELSGN